MLNQKLTKPQMFLPLKKRFCCGNKLYMLSSKTSVFFDGILYSNLFQLRFENLSDKDKISVTSISNSNFSEPFLRMLAHRNDHRLFNLSTERWVDGIDVGSEDQFFEQLLDHLRVAYLSQPVLYFKSADVMDIRMLNWLNSVSNSRVFQYASKCKKGQQNPLWFSKYSYRYLQDWLANQIQIVIVHHFLNKSVSEFLPSLLQAHLKVIGKQVESLGLSLCLTDVRKKSKSQLASLKTKLKEEQDKFIEYRQQKLISNIDVGELVKKKSKKKTKKKQVKHEEKQEYKQEQKKQINVLEETQSKQIEIIQEKLQSIIENNFQTTTQKIQFYQRHTIMEMSTLNHQKTQEIKEEKLNSPKKRNNSSSRNLIKVSPKRTRSPQYLRNREMLEQSQIKEKYSEEDKASFAFTEDQKSSEPTVSLGQSNFQEKVGPKRRRKRAKKQNQKLNEVKQALFSRLTLRQMDNLVDQLGIQTNSLYNHKIISFQRVRVFVQSLYPSANAILFGSNAIGLSLPNSDVDILLTELRCLTREQASQILAQIAVQINAMGWVVSCSTYLWAKVPIVKLQIDTSISFLQTKRRQDLFRVYNPALLYQLDHVGEVKAGTIKVDITINIEGITSVGYESTVLMRDWIIRIPILQKLVLLFKYILSAQGYNSNFAGGIGSYCLFVMIAAYLKQKEQSHNELDLSKQFQNILKWYGEDFDNMSRVVWLREEGTCFISEYLLDFQIEQTKRGLLKLIDPITSKPMNSSCNEYNNIKMQFRRILQEIKEWQTHIEDELRLGPVTPPELLRVIQTKKSADKWLNKFEQKHNPSLRAIIQRTNN